MYKVFDSFGKLVRGNFTSYLDALSYKLSFGSYGWYISR